MKREELKQTNYRLPESLVRDLKEVAEMAELSQTQIVKQAVETRIRQLRRVAERRQKAEPCPA